MARRRNGNPCAFKAVQEGKQVVYLVPTTILAQQHYNTFCPADERFPGKSRFALPIPQPKRAERETIEDLKKAWWILLSEPTECF